MTPRLRWTIGLVLLLGIAGSLSAQSDRPAAFLDDLLAEVRALRGEISRASAVSIRTQLLTARLQLQEQRILFGSRQLAEVQRLIATARQQSNAAELSLQLVNLDEARRTLTPGELEDFEREIAQRKFQLQGKVEAEQQLSTQERELFNSLSAEQGRWADFNQRLDEIERSLASPSSR
jgi:hypothetical protein